jgi:cytoskeletal protein RodZ
MLTSIRCEQCGYESESRFRFCGMCGTKLPLPSSPDAETSAARPERVEPIRSVSAAPTFLGLSDEPTSSSSVTYLLEDELSTGHWARTIALILVFAALGAAAWHWRTPLRAYVTARLAQEPSNNQADAAAPPEAPTPSSASELAPPTANPSAPSDKPDTGVRDLPPTPPQSSAPPAPSPAALPAPTPQDAAQPPAKTEQTAQNQAQTTPNEAPSADSQVSKSTAPQVVEKPSPVHFTADQLEAEGEKYLYGTGVPVNCDRAQKDLFAAAGQTNAKAYSVLGTMYATGHCASRDLPLAYHWFAKALQQDPGNTRLQRDLQVLWNQMSADERQVAMSTRR